MRSPAEPIGVAAEALGRYKLRTALSVLGVVLGIAAVIAMLSVSDGARREALAQVEALGLDNLVARWQRSTAPGISAGPLTTGDAEQMTALVPGIRAVSPVVERILPVTRAGKTSMSRVLGVRPAFQDILHLSVSQGRMLSAIDDATAPDVCVLGGGLARQLFGYGRAVGERVRIDQRYVEVIGVLSEPAGEPTSGAPPATLGFREMSKVAVMPLAAVSGRSLAVVPTQPADEIWIQVADADRLEEISSAFGHALASRHRGRRDFEVIVPRELLAQRFRMQRTFGIVVGSVAVLALLVGGIGIMNIMLTSVIERTHEIGIRRTVGATRRDVTVQFLIESLLMTLTGGAAGIVLGAALSFVITAYAGWATSVSATAVALAFLVSFAVGVGFGLYPAIKAAELQPVDALRYE